MRSFRFLLGVRVTVAMTAAVGAVALLSYLALRQVLDGELDASLVNVASIQAAAVTDNPTGEMRFQEWDLTPVEAASIRDLNRYAQIWNAEGESLVRMRSISEDLPLDRGALTRAAEGELSWAEGSFQGIPIRALYYPLERLGELHTRHVLQVAAPLEVRNRTLRTVGIALLAILATIAASTFMGAWWLAGSTVRPVGVIIDQAEEIAQGSPRRRIEAFADTWEYQRLVQVLNRMLSRLEAALETQRRFTADASHELRTPLTVLRGELEVALRRDRTAQVYVRVLDSALEEAERLSRLAEDLLTLTRSEAGMLEPQIQRLDLAERIHRTLDRLAGESELQNVEIVGQLQEPLLADVDPDLIDRVVWNLVGNALKFSSQGGEVSVSLTASIEGLVLEVLDTGPGIPPDKIKKVFERFYRVDESRTPDGQSSGTGLGLAIAKAIVELHGGRISAGNRPEGGAVFRVTLPGVPTGSQQHEESFMNV
jgi:two-component system OmpR family sensor kinase